MSADDQDQNGSGTTNEDGDEAAPKKKGKLLSLLLFSVIIFSAGAGAGVYGWTTLNGPIGALMEEPVDHEIKTKAPKLGDAEHEIGRIVVSLSQVGVDSRPAARLLIDPVIVYESDDPVVDKVEDDGRGDDAVSYSPLDKHHSEIRDVFIEYLSQLRRDQVEGSYGLMNLRTELLRRARMVSGDNTPKAILIRDFLLQ